MATYVNDLRLKEIGTGESSGTWGTETNVNLELIGEALSFGTEGITTNADTHTSTVADGSTDPARSMYIKYTGTLDSACTITIAPNTLSRLHFIENGTSGSQNIIISQGSGSNVTIPPGDVKVVYLDGAGSGAAVVDAFASLNVVDLKVEDDLTVTDDVSIGGLATVGETLGVTGVLTANAGVVIDNITIDGTEIDLSSGDLTLDVAGNILLNADGGGVYFQDASLLVGSLQNSSSDFLISAEVADKDIIFRGIDGSSTIDALKLDMSNAGRAFFNVGASFSGDVAMGDNNTTKYGQGEDLLISSDGTDGKIVGPRKIKIDAADEIHLDADSGIIRIQDDAGDIGMLQMTSSDFIIRSMTSDKDIIFKGNDGGSVITALTLDMSDAGEASFNSDVNVANLRVADDISHTGDTDTYISFETNARTDYAGGTRLVDLNVGGITLNEDGGGVDIRMESSNLTHAFFSDASEDVILVGSNTGTVNSGFNTLATTDGGLQIGRPGIDDAGGSMHFSFIAEQDTYKTFATLHDQNASGVTFLLNATRTIDQNRHRTALVRYAHSTTFTEITTSEQNTTVDYRADGANLQLRFTSAGNYVCTIMVLSSG